MKPILFNTAMVCAILDGRKSVTRRVVRPPALDRMILNAVEDCIGSFDSNTGEVYPTVDDCRYQPSDILYVRERWRVQCAKRFDAEVRIEYMAGGPMTTVKFPRREDFDVFVDKWADNKWHPSIHMPKEAARLFLRVTGVRVERLQDITEEQAEREGFYLGWKSTEKSTPAFSAKQAFGWNWNLTVKNAELPRYGWADNPWVWVIEFERVSKEEAV